MSTIFLPQSDYECRKGVQGFIMDGMLGTIYVPPMEPGAREKMLRHFLDHADVWDEILDDSREADKGE